MLFQISRKKHSKYAFKFLFYCTLSICICRCIIIHIVNAVFLKWIYCTCIRQTLHLYSCLYSEGYSEGFCWYHSPDFTQHCNPKTWWNLFFISFWLLTAFSDLCSSKRRSPLQWPPPAMTPKNLPFKLDFNMSTKLILNLYYGLIQC